jgi:UDP-N-acetyl-D-glucosamine dehydrogenase
VVNRAAAALDTRLRKGLNGARVLVIGAAYKKNADDTRESPALRIIELLEGRGAHVSYHDPFVPTIGATRQHGALAGRSSVSLNRAADYDLALIVTDHDGIDWQALVAAVPLVIDTRNATRDVKLDRHKIVKA